MRRKTLSASELEELLPRLQLFLSGLNVKKAVKKGVGSVELEGSRVVTVAGFLFLLTEEAAVPVLAEVNSPIIDKLPSVWVDMGAVPKVASGADVMRPGVVRMDVFRSGDMVVVRDILHSKPIAVGKALYSSDEAFKLEKGKIIKTLHHVDDRAWQVSKELL